MRSQTERARTGPAFAVEFGAWCVVRALAFAALLVMPTSSIAQTADVPAAKAAPKRTKAGARSPSADQSADAQGSAARKDPAAIQASVEGAAKLIEAGKTDQAISVLSAAISAGNLPSQVMARALYLRGAAYRKQQKPALAISDLTSALWLKGGLNDADKADATQQRAAAYGEAGLDDQGQAIAAGTPSQRSKSTAPAGSLAANAGTPEPGPKRSTSDNFFQSVFNSGGTQPISDEPSTTRTTRNQAYEKAQAVAKPVAAVPITPAPAPAAAPPQVPRATIAAATTPAVPANVGAAPARGPTARTEGVHQARVALVRTMPEAETVVARLKTQYPAALGDRNPAIGQAAFGNMGTFFQVNVGPFPSSADAGAVCTRLKGSGLDCVPVHQ